MSVNMRCIITVLIMKKGHVSNSQNVKDSLHGNKRLRKIIINLRIKVEICISTHSNADIVCYRATELNERNSVRLIVDRTHTHTHTCLMALFPGLSGWAGTRKVNPIWILLKQETVSGSGISWAICKSARRSRQITTPAPHHSVFYRPDALPATQPTASKHWRHNVK